MSRSLPCDILLIIRKFCSENEEKALSLLRSRSVTDDLWPETRGFCMHHLPRGTVTLLFTDMEGSTRLLQQLGERYTDLLEEYRQLLRAAFQRWNGHEVDTLRRCLLRGFCSSHRCRLRCSGITTCPRLAFLARRSGRACPYGDTYRRTNAFLRGLHWFGRASCRTPYECWARRAGAAFSNHSCPRRA